MKATILRLDYKDLNGRVYTREVGKDIVKQINERKEVFGRIGYSKSSPWGGVSLDKISHVISNARILGDEIVCDVKLLETREGHILKPIIDKCVFRPNGAGELEEDGTIKNCQVISVDAIPIETDAF